jgi:DNA-directed RNA polymerase specialized sigma24 family protein
MRKEHLKDYRQICEELRQLNNERVKWLARAERSTRAPSMTPAIGQQHDPMPLIMDRLTEIRASTDALTLRLCDAKLRIERAIDSLPSVQRQVMRARYIEGRCWEDISRETSYSVAQLHRIHQKALGGVKFLHSKGRTNTNKCTPVAKKRDAPPEKLRMLPKKYETP